MTPHALGFIIVAITAAIAFGDWLLFVRYGSQTTISGVFRRCGKVWPMFYLVLSFSLGLLVGHVLLSL